MFEFENLLYINWASVMMLELSRTWVVDIHTLFAFLNKVVSVFQCSPSSTAASVWEYISSSLRFAGILAHFRGNGGRFPRNGLLKSILESIQKCAGNNLVLGGSSFPAQRKISVVKLQNARRKVEQKNA